MKEIWKTYKIRNKTFEISNLGNVKGETNVYNDRTYLGDRHSRVSLLYIIVDFLFRGPLPKGYCIHHIDGNKRNDSLDNLQRITIEEHTKIHHKNNNTISQKISQALTGKPKTEQHKQSLRNLNIGLRFYNNGIITIRCKECPEGFVPGILKTK